ncbi:FMN-dependent oxidoreductase, nitrilotriacetate monooxygenase family [Rhizobium sp. PDO1-076]|uniref:LLM class flavin-dependent oxidoreductase n=1 Tax=Rhizobium sp. PDO1-076 TaxID=1125979 RepID=UPI00024E3C72|nr:LLM class flavin-dependent oxidoreductase [Rhizobium sp. PDO1-076]EHS52653.1 FMN-dependent oxidoreductase, nitrilotriacetate monooxygenase family [Rhizobium sp. PDO1-076]
MPKQILFNAFSMNCVGHINHGLWTHPRDQSTEFNTLRYWTDLARTLERGLFDGIFLADILGVYDVYGGSVDLTLRESIQLPVHDPMMLVSAMSAVTEHLGFGVTVNANAEPPYLFARRMSTLDHLTGGRMGWNIVTGYLDSAARAIGNSAMTAHDDRYDQAEEALELLYKLWEGSWDDDAVRKDKTNRVYADPAKVHAIHHAGRFYRSEGYHLTAPSPQRTPVLYQAGTSERGRRFAARHAECIFISAPDAATARKTSRLLRADAVEAGRKPEDIKIFVGISIVPSATEAEAQEKHVDYCRYASPEAGMAHFSAGSGIDLAKLDLDDPIVKDSAPGNAIQSGIEAARKRGLTKRQLLDGLGIGGRYPTFVGTGSQIADSLARFVEEGEIDGFNLTRTVVPESYEDFVTFVVPELQARGLYKTAYSGSTLRHQLFGAGPRLSSPHPAADARRRKIQLQTDPQ